MDTSYLPNTPATTYNPTWYTQYPMIAPESLGNANPGPYIPLYNNPSWSAGSSGSASVLPAQEWLSNILKPTTHKLPAIKAKFKFTDALPAIEAITKALLQRRSARKGAAKAKKAGIRELEESAAKRGISASPGIGQMGANIAAQVEQNKQNQLLAANAQALPGIFMTATAPFARQQTEQTIRDQMLSRVEERKMMIDQAKTGYQRLIEALVDPNLTEDQRALATKTANELKEWYAKNNYGDLDKQYKEAQIAKVKADTAKIQNEIENPKSYPNQELAAIKLKIMKKKVAGEPLTPGEQKVDSSFSDFDKMLMLAGVVPWWQNNEVSSSPTPQSPAPPTSPAEPPPTSPATALPTPLADVIADIEKTIQQKHPNATKNQIKETIIDYLINNQSK